MNMLNTKAKVIGVPMVFAAALMALLAVWSFGSASSAAGVETPWITSNVEYTVTDAMGRVKAHEFFHNATSSSLLGDAEDRLSATATIGADDVYTGIAICSNNPNAAANDGDTPSGTLCNLITAVSENNPVTAGTVNPGTNTYNIVQTFTATGGITITELQLVKSPTDTTQPVVAEIGAFRDVSVTLTGTDTIQITWTVTIS